MTVIDNGGIRAFQDSLGASCVSSTKSTRYLFETLGSFVFSLLSILVTSLTIAFFGMQVAVIVVPITTALSFYSVMHAFGRFC